jgi:hypothetical protein
MERRTFSTEVETKRNIRRKYRSLRNLTATLPATESLKVIHAYAENLERGRKIPPTIQVHQEYYDDKYLGRRPHLWELELLAKEIILNGSLYGTRTLRRWAHLAVLLNTLRDLENEISKLPARRENILFELHRISHRQFIWQLTNDASLLLRYFKILNHASVAPIATKRLGLSPSHFYMLGMGLFSTFADSMHLVLPIPTEEIGVTAEEFEQVVARFSASLFELQDRIQSSQSIDQNFAYNFNPLRATPLIRIEAEERRVLLVPIPTLVLWRFTQGAYYDLCDAPGFDSAFGKSFQSYIGKVLRAADTRGRFSIQEERQYHVGKKRKDSIDWIASDGSANLFIECKTKKLTFDSKLSLSATEAAIDLEKMAEFVVQGYKSIADALEHKYEHWKPTELPAFLMVVTLEDWWAFGNKFAEEIDVKVRSRLKDFGLADDIVDQIPYFTCGAADFEAATQIMNEVSIFTFMKKWNEQRNLVWGLGTFILNFYGEQRRRVSVLFERDWKAIHPALSPGGGAESEKALDIE